MIVRGIASIVVWLAAGLAALADDGQVTGVATYRAGGALPPGAVFEVVLEDIGRTDAAVELGRTATADPGPPPIGFAIDYDPATIDPRGTYAVRAVVMADGRPRFSSAGLHPVITRGAPTHVGIEMTPVPPPASRGLGPRVAVVAASEEGAATDEQGDESRQVEPDGQGPPLLRGLVTYMADAARFTDCRTGEGYPIAMEGDYEALEHAYLAAGQEAGAPVMASFKGSIVERPRPDGAGTGPAVLVERFVGVWPGEECVSESAQATLTDTYWKIVRLGELELPPGDGRREPHLVLRPSDARFIATAGCNQMVGGFELAGERLRFGEAAATRMSCPPPLGDWEQQLSWTLSATAAWKIEGQTLELYDPDGAAIATFRAVGTP
jgi:heat shock protein HslJ/uncharacterized lipoprotein YbaY